MKIKTISNFFNYNVILISCLTAIFISKLDDYIVSVSLPTMAHHFDVSTTVVSRIIIIYFLVLTSTLLIWGKLGDKIGLKKILLIGLFIFGIGSFLCGFADNINHLILYRFIQGIGASILLVISQAMISYYISPEKQAKAFGLLTTAAAVGMSIGPTLGGFISEYLSWNYIFWINIPICIFVIGILLFNKQKSTSLKKIEPDNKLKFDLTGSLLIFFCLATFVFALNMGHDLNWNYIIISCLIASIVFLILFIIRENKCQDPLLNVKLLHNMPFSLTILTSCIAFLLIGGNLFLIPFYLVYFHHLTFSQAGLVMMMYPLFFLITSLFIGKILKKHSCWSVWFTGISFTLISFIFFNITINLSGIIFTIIFLAIMGIGLGLFFAPNTKYAMDFISPQNAGMASGIYRTFNHIGMVFGICFFELIYTHFATHMGDSTIDLQITGFKYSYIFGTVMTIIAIIFTIYVKKLQAN